MENAHLGFVSLACGIVFIGAAVIMLLFPPRKINDFYGYRTSTSKKSQERWDFAQRFSSWRMIEAGIVLTIVSIFLEYGQIAKEIGVVVGIALLIASCLYMFLRTESAIKKKFPL
ncbi:SdpI family protein [Flavobacterium selenitireducens]|uniref:SdpI family protein n=1 Tax=Flavobacterium selenitireducens TaxID=2722704 RepID=UPI00168B6E8C|nr:SdpI family protein [Flavobacterium selenitireducens]MBD3583772.1 SdpI family protein [Flavobacterium selenitireducens]